jgi:hypothetical protein
MKEIIQREADRLAKALPPTSLRAPLLQIIEPREVGWYDPTESVRVLRNLPEFGEKESELSKLEAEFREMEKVDDIREIERDSNLDETEKEAHIKARVGQGQFRKSREHIWENKCAVLGCSTRELLKASHIKPWSECENKTERLDSDNGLLLAAHLYALFDAGLISFENSGSMIIYARIYPDDRAQLILGGNLRKDPWEALRVNLAYHRKNQFKWPEA